MNEDQYFEKSIKRKCVLRCPILNYCTRRAYTIYFYSDYSVIDYENNVVSALQKESVLPDDFLEKRIPLSGEVPAWSKGLTSLYFNNMCPEVNLFDNLNGLPFSKGLATTDGDWDHERNTEKFIGIKYKHYTECTEYNTYISTNKKNPKASSRRRSPISQTLRFEIYQRDNFKCQYCGRSKDDGIKLVLDHKIPYSDGGKDDYHNLITTCEDCNNGKSNKRI